MLNAPHNSVFPADSERDEFIAPGSPLRLWVIGVLFTMAAVVVMVRVYWVQTRLPTEYLRSLMATTTEEEIIPARDGRILADSVVLAADVELYAVELHYRWLQSTPDPGWIKLQLRQKLSRDERRDAELVAEAEHDIVRTRARMLQAVCDTTGLLPTELQARCERVEQRVSRIIESVNRRRILKEGGSDTDSDEGTASGSQTDSSQTDSEDHSGLPETLMSWARSVRELLTTPPKREDSERIIVKEEESWHSILENVGADAAAEISEHPERFPGVRIVARTQRTYPQNDLAVHVVGARTRLTGEDPEVQKQVSGSADPEETRMGRSGVERSYNFRLSGIPGVRRIVRDRRQRVISSEVVRKPVSGRDVQLTLDMELQALAEQLLAESLGDAERTLLRPASETEHNTMDDPEALGPPEPEHIPVGGCVVVMEADSGRIVAAASAPDFDLTMFTNGTEAQWQAVNSDVRRPFVCRFTGMALPPGSTFKILTALAGLQSGAVAPDTLIDCAGYLNNPDEHRCLIFRLHGGGHREVDLRTAMAQSCNVYFFEAAQRMGIASMTYWADQMGFGHETGIDLPFEKRGNVPSAGSGAGRTVEAARRRFEREALGLSIGQSRLTVTPLQMARMMAFVANGGWLVTPHVVSDEGVARKADEIDDSPYRPARRRLADVTDKTLQSIREGLLAVVEEPIGTGFRSVRLPGVKIAGKTGTAEASPGKPDHAWFAGYAPAANPRYVFVVVLEHGGSGGKSAGPVVRELARSLAQRGLLEDDAITHIR